MIGVDISDRSIKIAEIAGKDNMSLRTVCWSPLPAGHIRRGIIQDVPAVTAALQETFAKCSPQPLSDPAVVASIPETQSFVRVIDVPQMSDAETDEAVQWAVRQHIPFDLDRVYLDWQSLPGSQLQNGRREVLVGAVQRNVVDPLLQVLDNAGLAVMALELEAQAILRSLLPRESADIRGVLVIDIGATFSEIIFFDGGVMRFTTSIQSGGDDLTAALAKELQLDVNTAAEKKAVIGVTDQAGENAVVSATLHTATVDLLRKIERVVREIAVQFRSESVVRAILLSGGSANLPGIERVMAEVFPGIPVQKGSPWINLQGDTKRGGMTLSPESASHFVTALGLALRTSAPGGGLHSGRELNLLPAERRTFLNRQRMIEHATSAVRSLVAALIIVTVCGVIAGGLLRTMAYLATESVSADLQAEVASYQALRDEIAKQNVALEFMHQVSTKRLVWSAMLPDLFSRIPSGVTLTRMSGQIAPARTVSFNGQAANRSVLISLNERLADIPWVENVTAPHTNLIEPVNPLYSFELSLKADAAGNEAP